MKLTHIRLLVNNFEACFRFYRDVMHFTVQWGAPNSDYADFGVGADTTLALFKHSEMAAVIHTNQLPDGDALQDRVMLIFEVANLEAAVAELGERRARFVTAIEDHPDWGIRTVYLRDPDGTLIELNSALPRFEWTEELSRAAEESETGKADTV